MTRPRTTHAVRMAAGLMMFCCLHIAAADTDPGAADEPCATDPQPVLAGMQEANSHLQTLRADVLYTRSIPLLDDHEQSPGHVVFIAPDRVRLRLDKPRNEEMISDGRAWWILDHRARQVERYEIAEHGMEEASFLNLGFGNRVDDLQELYHVEILSVEPIGNADEQEPSGRRWRLGFRPACDETAVRYDRMEMSVTNERYLPDIIVLYESDGEIAHTFRLHNMVLNEEVDPSVFVGHVPRGYSKIRH